MVVCDPSVNWESGGDGTKFAKQWTKHFACDAVVEKAVCGGERRVGFWRPCAVHVEYGMGLLNMRLPFSRKTHRSLSLGKNLTICNYQVVSFSA